MLPHMMRPAGPKGPSGLLQFVSGKSDAILYDTDRSFAVYGGSIQYQAEGSPYGGKLVRFRVPIVRPGGDLTLVLQAAGGGGPNDDSDGATPSGAGAYASMTFDAATYRSQLYGRTLVLAIGDRVTGTIAQNNGQVPKLFSGIIPYATKPELSSWLRTATTGHPYAGFGAVDSLLYFEDTGELILAVQGGCASANYDGPPAQTASGYANPNRGVTRASIQGVHFGSKGVRAQSPSPWASVDNVAVRVSCRAPGVNALAGSGGSPSGYGGANPVRGEGETALFYLQLHNPPNYDPNVFRFNIPGGLNVNLLAAAVAAGWGGGAVEATVTGTVGSSSVGTPSLIVDGSFPQGVTLIVDQGAAVVGRGGNGTAGGVAIQVITPVSIINNGVIGGGGGSNSTGQPGAGFPVQAPATLYNGSNGAVPGTAGAGGAGGGLGADANSYSYTSSTSGDTTDIDRYIAGTITYYDFKYTTATVPARAAGAAIIGYSQVDFTNNGNVYGARNP